MASATNQRGATYLCRAWGGKDGWPSLALTQSVGPTDGNFVISAGNQLTIGALDIGAGKDLTLAAGT
ncbi:MULTISPECIES: hypothetical protein [Xanthomonas]|uniref:hypothetical protein n=1 Tax=Xanthomonas TaxID=338 RepID=UPI0013A5F2CB|nr:MULTISPECIES: hypothetical protein [Xanthomonas]